ncbi:MAG: hypothetical protein ACOX8S_04225 [Christensenellales bacterium]
MKYDLSDFKQIADELLSGLTVDQYMAARIKNTSRAPSKKAPRKRWLAYASASLATCAAAAVFIIAASLGQLNISGNERVAENLQSGGAIQTAQATPLSMQIAADAGKDSPAASPEIADIASTALSNRVEISALPKATFNPLVSYEVFYLENGLCGVKSGESDEAWLIEPIYDSGRIEDGVAIMQSGPNIFEIPLKDE